MTAMRTCKNLGRATRRINPRNVRNPNRKIAIFDLARMCTFCLDENRLDLLQASDSFLFVDLLHFGSANVNNATHPYFIV